MTRVLIATLAAALLLPSAVVAGIVGDTLAIAQRDAGGAWRAPQTFKVGNVASHGLAVGVSPSGYAVVAWVGQSAGSTAVHAVRRAPGGTFGAPELASGTEKLSDVLLGVTAGIGDDGVAIVIWQQPGIGRTAAGAIEQSMAAPGAPFSHPAELGTSPLPSPKLAVAPDGRALVVFGDVGLRVSERPPGGSFGAPQSLSEDAGTGAVAIQPDGSAMVAWRSAAGLVVARRTGTGPLGPPIQVLEDSELGEQNVGGIAQFDGDPAPPEDDSGVDLRMLTAADGSTVFSWGEGMRVFAIATIRTRAALLPAGGFTASAQTLGAPVRPVSTLAPVLAGGTPALAWGDSGADGLDGRLHYALHGAPAAAPEPQPVVRIGKPERAVVRGQQQVVIPVTCSAACDVGAHTSRDESPLAVSLHHAGRTTLAFPPSIAPVKAARVHIAIIASAPGATTVQNRSIDPRLRRIPDPPLPAARDIVATRHGTRIVVTWRIAKPAPDVDWYVYGSGFTRSGHGQEAETRVEPSGALSFHATLRHAGAGIRMVQLIAIRRGQQRTREVSVDVR